MNLSNIENLPWQELVKYVIPILTTAYGIWQTKRKNQIKRLMSNEAVGLHKNIAFVLGAVQAARNDARAYTNPLYEIGRSEGLANAILLDSAKLYCNISEATIDDIEALIANGQLSKDYRHIYLAYSKPRKGWFNRLIIKLF